MHYYQCHFMAPNLIVLTLDFKMTTYVLENRYNTHFNLIHSDRTFLAFIPGKVILIFREGKQ